MGIFDRTKLEKSVKRTKQWWDALTSDERSFIVRAEYYPKYYRKPALGSSDRLPEQCLCVQCESYLPKGTPYDRGLCVHCAEKYNGIIAKANKHIELLTD